MREYSSFAPYYDRFMSFLDYPGEAAAIAAFFIGAGCENGRILDLGAGSGGHLLPMAERGFDMTGVDLSPAMVAIMKEKLVVKGRNANVEVGDIRDLHFPADGFDAAYCWGDTIHHLIGEEDFACFLASVRRVLRPGGFLLFNWREPDYFEELIAGGAFFERHGEDFLLWEAHEEGESHCSVSLNGFIKNKNADYKRVEECHHLRIWCEEKLADSIASQGFTIGDEPRCGSLFDLLSETEFQKICILENRKPQKSI